MDCMAGLTACTVQLCRQPLPIPQAEDRWFERARLLFSPLALLCFLLWATRSARVKPSWAAMKLMEWVGPLPPRHCSPVPVPHQSPSPACISAFSA